MIISKEQFNKLNQLDRIEYRQIEDKIKRKYHDGSIFLYFLNHALFPIIAFFLLFVPIVYPVYGSQVYDRLLITISRTRILTGVFIVLCFVADILYFYLYKRHTEKLNQKFFSINTKLKSK